MGFFHRPKSPRSLDSFSWFESLYIYSRPPRRRNSVADDDEDEDEPALGPDGDLVSAMVGTAVVPRLCKIIQGGAFDPYSEKHVRRMVDLAEQIEASVGREKHEVWFLRLEHVPNLCSLRYALTTDALEVCYYYISHIRRLPPNHYGCIPLKRLTRSHAFHT